MWLLITTLLTKKIKGLPHIERIITYWTKTENIEDILNTLILIKLYGVKYIEMFETKISSLVSLADSLLENLKDKEIITFICTLNSINLKLNVIRWRIVHLS